MSCRVCFTNDSQPGPLLFQDDGYRDQFDVVQNECLSEMVAKYFSYLCTEYVLQMILTKMINPPITLAMSVAPRGSWVWQPPAAWIMYCSFNHLTISNRVYLTVYLTECSFHHLAKSNNIHAFSAKANPSNVCIY